MIKKKTKSGMERHYDILIEVNLKIIIWHFDWSEPQNKMLCVCVSRLQTTNIYSVIQFSEKDGGTVSITNNQWFTPRRCEVFWPVWKDFGWCKFVQEFFVRLVGTYILIFFYEPLGFGYGYLTKVRFVSWLGGMVFIWMQYFLIYREFTDVGESFLWL